MKAQPYLMLVSFETGFFSVALEPVLKLAIVDQAGLELTRDLPASASLVLGLKACIATTWQLVLIT